MLKHKLFKWYTIIPVILILVIGFVLWLSPYGELSKINNKQIEGIGFAGANKGEVFFVFPEKQRQEFIEMLKEADINIFPTHVGSAKGGSPVLHTRILFTDKSSLDFSYAKLKGNTYLRINGKFYICDKNTIEKFSLINYECQILHLERSNMSS